MRMPKVLVIGAGIAGLTAAWQLQKAGMNVKVLEASGRVGGRMSTDSVNGFVVDRGAQFLSSHYALLLSMVRELGACARHSPHFPLERHCAQWKSLPDSR